MKLVLARIIKAAEKGTENSTLKWKATMKPKGFVKPKETAKPKR